MSNDIDIRKIASTPHCSETEVKEFFFCLQKLLDHCEFNINSTTDENAKKIQPLLIRY